MNNFPSLAFDVVVIGGGPAGVAAATVAAESGASAALLDDNPEIGGQIWRAENKNSQNAVTRSWFERCAHSSVQLFRGARVFHIQNAEIFAETADTTLSFTYRKLILATGARERFLPFPGWTLPNVLGAGALQAFLKSGLSVRGKRIVVAGTGPLLLAVASYARKQGANILCIAEQTSWNKFAKFGLSMVSAPGKLRDAVRLSWELLGVPHWKNAWPVTAHGTDRLESVRLFHNGRPHDVPCDYLACGFHLIPNTELAEFLGCPLQNGFVLVDEDQQTSQPNIFCAGEPTGIGGLELSLLEGQIAGYAATNERKNLNHLRTERNAHQVVVRALRTAFELRPELRSLAVNDTLVCRCEDVSFARLREHSSWREAKLQTRCGMGPCQGKVCGPATEFLFGWRPSSLRSPLFPVKCSSLAAIPSGPAPEQIHGGSQQ